MKSGEISRILGEFAHNLQLKEVPKEVVEKIKLHILDTLGIAIASCNLEFVSPIVRICKMLSGPQESTVIGQNLRVAAPYAAMANSTMAHSLDYDDTHLGSVHQGCVAIPTSFALGEKVGASGREVLESIIITYEVNARLGLVSPRGLHPRGFHPTPILGVFGAALAASKLMGLSTEQSCWALGIAGSMSSGIGQPVKEGVPLKAFHAGIAAYHGILAALLAAEGYKGPMKVFEGEAGFYRAYFWGEKINLAQAISELGKRWETLNTSLKPYPSCHATHAAIDATAALKSKYQIKTEDIQECKVYLSDYALKLTRSEPITAYGAKFSIRYCVAVGLKGGYVKINDFTEEALKDKEVLKLMQKIRVFHDEKYDADEYAEKMVFPARVIIKTKDGLTYEEEVIYHKGTPYNPMSKDEVVAKFLDNIKFTKFKSIGRELINKVFNMENLDFMEISKMLS
jgi:2-methylcitrate dehydratase PrpD